MGIRLMAYSFLTDPWYALPIELLNGLTLGVYWSTMASYAYLVAPPGTASTLQGIFGAIFEGIGKDLEISSRILRNRKLCKGAAH